MSHGRRGVPSSRPAQAIALIALAGAAGTCVALADRDDGAAAEQADAQSVVREGAIDAAATVSRARIPIPLPAAPESSASQLAAAEGLEVDWESIGKDLVLAPIYGGHPVGDVTLEDLLARGGSGELMMNGLRELQRLHADLVSKIDAAYPDLRADELERAAAVSEIEAGELVLELDDDRRGRTFVRCPPEHAARVAELQMIALALANSRPYMTLIEAQSPRVVEAAKRGALGRELHDDGTGFTVVNAAGKEVAVFHHRIPGRVMR